jgi:hypothetical protein
VKGGRKHPLLSPPTAGISVMKTSIVLLENTKYEIYYFEGMKGFNSGNCMQIFNVTTTRKSRPYDLILRHLTSFAA